MRPLLPAYLIHLHLLSYFFYVHCEITATETIKLVVPSIEETAYTGSTELYGSRSQDNKTASKTSSDQQIWTKTKGVFETIVNNFNRYYQEIDKLPYNETNGVDLSESAPKLDGRFVANVICSDDEIRDFLENHSTLMEMVHKAFENPIDEAVLCELAQKVYSVILKLDDKFLERLWQNVAERFEKEPFLATSSDGTFSFKHFKHYHHIYSPYGNCSECKRGDCAYYCFSVNTVNKYIFSEGDVYTALILYYTQPTMIFSVGGFSGLTSSDASSPGIITTSIFDEILS